MLKREWGAKSNGKLSHLFIPSKTANQVPEFAMEDLPLGRIAALVPEFPVKDPLVELILQAFSCFTYVTAHSPALPSLYLRHSSFSNPSVASPTSQFILQPFFRFSYVTGFSLTSPGEPPLLWNCLDLKVWSPLQKKFEKRWAQLYSGIARLWYGNPDRRFPGPPGWGLDRRADYPTANKTNRPTVTINSLGIWSGRQL